jgi:hypothetical protein
MPPGQTEFTRDCAESTVATIYAACRLLTIFSDSEIQHSLLWFCLNACRVKYLLRVCPDIWSRADGVIWNTLDAIIRSPLADHQWTQACLPLNQGGIGILTAMSYKGPARISALHWYSNAESQLGLLHTAHFKFHEIPSLLHHVTSLVGPNVDPLSV